MPDFLSIKDAAVRYDKAEITIRRLVRNIANDAKHEDREHLAPSPEEVSKLKKSRKPFTYSISTELLDKAYLAKEIAKKVSAKNVAKHSGNDEVVGLLKKTNHGLEEQLRVKDDQIKALNQALDDLSERQRETNVLMKGLQEKLLTIPAPKKSILSSLRKKKDEVVDFQEAETVNPESSSDSVQDEQKGWWLW